MSVRGGIPEKRLARLIRILDAFARGEARDVVRRRERLSDETLRSDLDLLRAHTREELLALQARYSRAARPVRTQRECAYLVRGPEGFAPCGARAKGQYCAAHEEATRPIGRTVVMLGQQAALNTRGGRAR